MKESIKRKAEVLVCDKGHLIRLEQEGYNWYWHVPSQSVPGKSYKIPFDASDCPCDYRQLSHKQCTHMTAAQIVRLERARWERERRKREGLQDFRPKTARELQALAKRLGA